MCAFLSILCVRAQKNNCAEAFLLVLLHWSRQNFLKNYSQSVRIVV